MDSNRYQEHLLSKDEEFENICKRCGKCCGRDDDPCEHLRISDNGECYCDIYERRFGLRRTTGGNTFECVPIKEHIKEGTLRYSCAYWRISGKFNI